ncbi:ATP-dependent helicase [Patescibacteria group bacterium]
MSSEKKLNSHQKSVVRHALDPLLVVAGAGTGKTTTIIERIRYLITQKKVEPSRIFAATFTQKSAEEMLDRLDEIMPLGYEEPWIGTFHALCDRILRLEGFHIGIDPNFTVMTPTQQWLFIRDNIFDLGLDHFRPLGNPSTFISNLIKFFSRLQDEDTPPKEFINYAKKSSQNTITDEEKESASHISEISTAFKLYHQIKIKNSLYDFGDLITQTLHLFRSNNSILKKYQDLFTHILIDEFQDTNYAQYQLIKLLAPANNNPNLIVVGDDDQSIYKFRGAAISNILGFKKDYKKAKEIILTKNYRSVQSILDHSYKLIQHNNPDRLETKLGINKKLSSETKDNDSEQLIYHSKSHQEEIDIIIENIMHLVSTKNYTFKDFAILTRANNQLDPFVQSLKTHNIPYQRVGNRGLFDQKEVKSLIDFLYVLSNPEESASLFHFMHSDYFHVDPSQIIQLINLSRKNSQSLYETLQSFKDEKQINKVIDTIIKFQNYASKYPTSKVLHEYIIHTDYIQKLANIDSVENSLKIQNINLLFDHIKKFEQDESNTHITHFIEILNQWIEAGENPAQATIEDIDTVSLMTIHAAKGLEFPVVFIPSLIVGRFPTTNRKNRIPFPEGLIKETLPEGNYHIEEERRLLYVAMTRAKHHLYLSYADDYGGVRKRKPSGFLSETDLKEKEVEPTIIINSKNTEPSTITYLDKYKKTEIKSLSYTQIDDFNGCPLKYKYRYILKVPTLPKQSLTFGRTIHETLNDFHRLAQQGKKLSQKEFIDLYKSHFNETGYKSKEHKELRYKKGIEDLKNYYKTHKNLFGKPIHLERSFKIKIDDIIIKGKIDRIDEIEGGVEIIDYKTGKTKDQKTVDRDEQLSLYALASSEVFGLNPKQASLYFIDSGNKITTSKSQKQLENTKKKFAKYIQKIKTSDFKANPEKRRCSNFCEYNRICPFAIK